MLLGGVDLDLHGRSFVLAQQVLHGIHVVLPHVRQAAAVVVPVTAESLVHTVFVVRLVGGRAEPHVVVEIRRNPLRDEVLLAHPEEFPGEAGGARDGHLERPSQQAAVDQLLERLDGGAQAVEGIRETEPRIEAEDAVVALDGLHDALALADGAGHRFLAPDVLAGLRGLDGHDAVPVRGRGDMDDVDIGVGDQAAEIAIGLQRLVETLFAQVERALEMLAVDVADRHQTALLGAGEMVAALADAADADDAFGELVARRHVFRAAEHMARDDRQQRHAAQCFQKIPAGTHIVFRLVVIIRLSDGNCARAP